MPRLIFFIIQPKRSARSARLSFRYSPSLSFRLSEAHERSAMPLATAGTQEISSNESSGSPLPHNWPRFAVNTVASMGVAFVGKTALKAMINEERPDHSDNKSFPSGHAAIAFAAARSIDKEFRKESIWIPIAGYAAATALGIERIASDRHHWYDVAAGAALGYGAAELTWWLSDKFLGRNSNFTVGTSGNTVDVVYNF